MAKGGSRFGAGRPAYRVKAEQLHRIDVRELARRKLLSGSAYFSWSWNRGGEPSGSMSISVEPKRLIRLSYSYTGGGDAQHVNQPVSLIYRSCNFGGDRPWFQCPRCARTVAVLYLRSGRFACRHCQRVAYSSQSEDVMGRMWRKQYRIEARLDEGWTRPKGMRWCTYNLLLGRLYACEERKEDAFSEAVARFMPGLR